MPNYDAFRFIKENFPSHPEANREYYLVWGDYDSKETSIGGVFLGVHDLRAKVVWIPSTYIPQYDEGKLLSLMYCKLILPPITRAISSSP